MNTKLIYLDHAATTRTRPEVVEAMLPWFSGHYGNPSSLYQFGADSREAVAKARAAAAKAIGAQPEEIFFTAGGSESDNWALKAAAETFAGKGSHIITSKIEHHAVLHSCGYLESRGCEITYLEPDEYGRISPEKVHEAVRPDTILVSVMAANNEIGTIEPIREIGAAARECGVPFHTDAVQAFAHIPINVDEMNIDMMSASAHKFGGPKGVGFLYIRKGIPMRPLIHGGAQERNRRAGTENVPSIVGLGKAVELALAEQERENAVTAANRDYLIHRVLAEIPHVRLNGDPDQRLPGNANFSFSFIDGEAMLIMLDMKGICASAGSACASGSTDPSHVLLAIGQPPELAHGSLRLTLGPENTREEIDYTVEQLKQITEQLRGMSPLYRDFLRKQEPQGSGSGS